MHTLHIIDLDPQGTIRAIKGVRAARKALGDAPGALLRASKECVDDFRAGRPALVGEHENLDRIREAAVVLETDSGGCARAGIDVSPWELEMPSDNSPSYEACKTALVLMAACGGDPTMALSVARTLAHAADDEDFYESVATALLDTFPMRNA